MNSHLNFEVLQHISALEATSESWTLTVGRGRLLSHQGGGDSPAQCGGGRVESHHVLCNTPCLSCQFCWCHYLWNCLYPLVSLDQWALLHAVNTASYPTPQPQCCLVPLPPLQDQGSWWNCHPLGCSCSHDRSMESTLQTDPPLHRHEHSDTMSVHPAESQVTV